MGVGHLYWFGKEPVSFIDEEKGVEGFESVDDSTQILLRFSDTLRHQGVESPTLQVSGKAGREDLSRNGLASAVRPRQ